MPTYKTPKHSIEIATRVQYQPGVFCDVHRRPWKVADRYRIYLALRFIDGSLLNAGFVDVITGELRTTGLCVPEVAEVIKRAVTITVNNSIK